ncbi:MAG: hypothetical protein OQJ97_05280 [Rhodospirillales bacterium]|nr:hypothetical protein [Rhodospirillales bacterium]
MAETWGVCRVITPDSIEDEARVTDTNGYDRQVNESYYRAHGYMPPFDELHPCEDGNT